MTGENKYLLQLIVLTFWEMRWWLLSSYTFWGLLALGVWLVVG